MKKRPKIGVALGGGGAKGISHIGVLEILIENNIPIDYIAGTSMGSVIGAYYSLNLEVKGIKGPLTSFKKRGIIKLLDFALPKKGLIAGKKLKTFIRTVVMDKEFSDTQIPFKVVATDLFLGKEHIFFNGKLADAIHASVSVPGIFEPVTVNGHTYVDGGLVNPTPTNIVKEMGADIVIGIDHHMEPRKIIKKPNIFDILLQSLEIMRKKVLEHNLEKAGKEVIMIRPFTKGVAGAYDFMNQEFVDSGRKAAMRALPKIKKAIDNWEN